MNDKIKLLELGNKKIANNKDFIAYFLNQYISIEDTTKEAIMSTLRCNEESYYKLGLCKVPVVNDINFLTQLSNVSSYIGISNIELNKIIKRVNSVISLRSIEGTNSYLMAARDKKKKVDD